MYGKPASELHFIEDVMQFITQFVSEAAYSEKISIQCFSEKIHFQIFQNILRKTSATITRCEHQ